MPEKISLEQPKLGQKKELPTGEAREVSKQASSRWKEQLVLLSQVRNRVLDINEEVNFPLRLEKNKQSPLGLFIEATLRERAGEILPKEKRGEYWPEHGRSVLLGRLLFNDKDGRIWRDIDIKGIGQMHQIYDGEIGFFEISELGLRGYSQGLNPEHGLLDRDVAFVDWDLSEQFLKAGIRTHRVLAVIQLDEFIVNGQKISLKKARKQGIIHGDFHPVVEVRAFGTKARVSDATGFLEARPPYEKEWAEVLLKDAKKIAAQEQGEKGALTTDQYMEWFAKTLGRNVALMHKNGWVHGYLSPHNISLDCRIVDLDSVRSVADLSLNDASQLAKTDLSKARHTSERLIKKICELEKDDEKYGSRLERFQNLFQQSYKEILSSEEREQLFQKLQKEQKTQ